MSDLEKAYSGAIFDVLREMGYPHQVLPPEIMPLQTSSKVAGPVFTMTGNIADISEDESLLRWCKFLSKAAPGSVVVCQPNDSTLAHMGELSAETLKFRGVKGYVVDGGCRDTGFIEDIGFPVFCRYNTPADVVGRWAVGAMEEPVVIGSIKIQPDDYIMGDRDGVVVIPSKVAEECAARALSVMSTENLVRKAILSGMEPTQAYLQYGRF